MALHLNQVESPLPKAALCQVWLILAHWFWRRIEDRRTVGRQAIRKAHLSLIFV